MNVFLTGSTNDYFYEPMIERIKEEEHLEKERKEKFLTPYI